MRKDSTKRMKNWKYNLAADYLVTSVVGKRVPILAINRPGRYQLTAAGKVIEEEILWSHEYFQHVIILAYRILPDHIHIILRLTDFPTIMCFPMPRVVGAIKSRTSKRIRRECFPDFRWQRSYSELPISCKGSLIRATSYVKNNHLIHQRRGGRNGNNSEEDVNLLFKECDFGISFSS